MLVYRDVENGYPVSEDNQIMALSPQIKGRLRQERVALILDAAEELVAEKGYTTHLWMRSLPALA